MTKTKNTAKMTAAAERMEALRLQVNAATAEAGTAREAADALTYRVRDGQTVSTEEWTTLPAAASMAEVKLHAIRKAYEQVREDVEHEQMEMFVRDAQERLGAVPDTESRLAELAAHVKAELDKIIAEVDAYNSTFWGIHDAARKPGTSSGIAYGTHTRPIVQEHGMYADHDGSGKLVRIHGEEFRDVGTLGLIDDVAFHVKELDAAEIPAQRFIPSSI